MVTIGGKPLPWRLTCLALTFTGVCWVLVKLWITDTQPSTVEPVPITLPEAPPLPGWDLRQSTPIAPTAVKGSRASHAYEFQRDQQQLEIDVHYLAPWTDGNVSRLLFVNTPLRTANARLQQREHPDTGFYGVLTYEGHAYLTACINPRGNSTITEQQKTHTRYATGLRPGRVFQWLLGQEQLWDGRCLWTLMRVPLEPDAPESPGNAAPSAAAEQAYQILESAWVPWHRWWQANYPPPVPQ